MFNIKQSVIKLNDSLNLTFTYNKYDWIAYEFEIKNVFNDVIVKFRRTNYPDCCGINILHNFYTDCAEVIAEDTLKLFFEKTRSYWRSKTQFVAVKPKITKWTEDEEGYEISETIGFEYDFEYNIFIDPLINVTKAKLISEFVNTNSGNKCYVYEFDGEKL